MSPALTERAGALADDPTVRRLVDEEYAQADRLRASILARFFGLLGALFLARWLIDATGAAPVDPWTRTGLLVGLITAVALAGVELLVRSRAHLRGGRRILVWYGSATLEIGWITAAWLVFGEVAPDRDVRYPGLVTFAALVVLSALRLDWRITLFTGALAASANVLIHAALNAAEFAQPQVSWAPSTVLLLTVAGLAALVAEQARRRTMHALAAVVARRELEREVMEVAAQERRRIGRDVHDGLGGRLSALTLIGEGLARRAESGAPVEARDIRELADLAREGVDEARRLSRGLDPAPLELGLTSALRGLADRTRATGLECSFVFEGEEEPFGREVTLHLYHIAQEAVTNALRHGDPSRIDIRLTHRPSFVALDVRDDGSGLPAVDAHEGLGLRTMAKRAELLDARLLVRPGPDGGTAISCVVPRDRRLPQRTKNGS